jgi:hypothetical protein
MGSVFRKNVTKPLPLDAQVIERHGKRHACWKDRKSKARSAPLTIGKGGADRIVIKARTYTAKYRDGSGIVREANLAPRPDRVHRRSLCERTKARQGGLSSFACTSAGQRPRLARAIITPTFGFFLAPTFL